MSERPKMEFGVWLGDRLVRPFATEGAARAFLRVCESGAEVAPLHFVPDAKYTAGVRPVRGKAPKQ